MEACILKHTEKEAITKPSDLYGIWLPGTMIFDCQSGNQFTQNFTLYIANDQNCWFFLQWEMQFCWKSCVYKIAAYSMCWILMLAYYLKSFNFLENVNNARQSLASDFFPTTVETLYTDTPYNSNILFNVGSICTHVPV